MSDNARTVGSDDDFRGFRRARPFIVAVAGVVVVLMIPLIADDPATTNQTFTGGTGADGIVDGDGPALESGESTEGASPDTPTADGEASAVIGGSGGAPAGGSGGSGSASSASGGSTAVTYPGIGTAAAMQNPNCDPKTGRIRFPSRYAPPCVAPWPAGADNGAKTYQGVTRDAIKVVVYLLPSETRNESAFRGQVVNTWDTFNEHFELWGRKVQVQFIEGSGTDEVSQRADAIKVANEMKPFLTTTLQDSVSVFSREIAARGMVAFDFNAGWTDAQAQAPRRWSVEIDDRRLIMHVAEYAGKRLAGRTAQWAGDAGMRTSKRTFGLVYPDGLWDIGWFDKQASKWGLSVADKVGYDQSDTVGAQERARVIISRMVDKKVTTVIAGTNYVFTAVLTASATAQGYFPEWMITGWGLQDVALFGRLYDQRQWSQAFGVGPIQTLTQPTNFETVELYRWHHGQNPPEGGANGSAWVIGYQMFPALVLAGPDLNPETFRTGAWSMPPSGGSYCRCTATIGISYGRRNAVPWDDYSGWDDVNEKWWDPNEIGPDEAGLTTAPGMYMKVDGGLRFNPGGWPTSDPKAFVRDGAVALWNDYPAAEAPPEYEHHSH